MINKLFLRISTRFSSFTLKTIGNFIIAVQFETAELGIIAFSYSFIALLSILIPFARREVYESKNKEKNFDDYFSIYFTLVSIILMINYVPLVLVIFLFFPEMSLFLVYVLIINTLSQFINIFFVNFIANKKFNKATFSTFFFVIFESIAQIFIALNIEYLANPLNLLFYTSIFFSALNLVFILIISKGEFVWRGLDFGLFREFLKESKPLIISYLVILIAGNVGKVLIAISYGLEDLAFYHFIESNIIQYLLIISGCIQGYLRSTYGSLFRKNDLQGIQAMARKVEKFFTIILLPVILLTYLFASFFINAFISDYSPSIPILYILILVPYFTAIIRPYEQILIPGKKTKQFAYINTFSLIIKTILIIIIVPSSILNVPMAGFGIMGLAFVEMFYWIIYYLIIRTLVRKYYDIKPRTPLVFHGILIISVIIVIPLLL